MAFRVQGLESALFPNPTGNSATGCHRPSFAVTDQLLLLPGTLMPAQTPDSSCMLPAHAPSVPDPLVDNCRPLFAWNPSYALIANSRALLIGAMLWCIFYRIYVKTIREFLHSVFKPLDYSFLNSKPQSSSVYRLETLAEL